MGKAKNENIDASNMIKAILEVYPKEFVAGIIGKSSKSVENYEKGASMHNDTFKKLSKVYREFTDTGKINATTKPGNSPGDDGYKDKYIKLLEEIRDKQINLADLAESVSVNTALLQTLYQAMLSHRKAMESDTNVDLAAEMRTQLTENLKKGASRNNLVLNGNDRKE